MVRVLTSAGLSGLVLSVILVLATPTTAAPDAVKGRAVFQAQCAICHSDARKGPIIIGPPLYGVVGRKAASVEGFPYSAAMKAAAFTWTPERLHAYLPAPRDYLPGVKMTYPGLKNPEQLDNLIAYLATLK